MEKGVIFTQDKKDIEVFFLKPQSPVRQETDFLPPIGAANPHNLPWAAFNEQDVNENSAGEGSHQGFAFEPSILENIEDMGGDWPHALTPQGDSLPIHPHDLDKVKGCGPCPVGHTGHQGTVGVKEDEADIFEAISECLEKFSATDLNVNDSGSRDILSITITRKVKNLLP